jgi:hypothetical protein
MSPENTHDCPDCDKPFSSAEALNHHRKAKHDAKPARSRSPLAKGWTLAIIVLLVLGVGLYVFLSNQKDYTAFAQCLSAKGVKFYGTFWCPHCMEQKRMFGQSKAYLPYIECSTPDGNSQTPICQQANITGYPTWDFPDGSRVPGTLTFEVLAQKTGCVLP